MSNISITVDDVRRPNQLHVISGAVSSPSAMLGPKMEMLVLTHRHDSLWKFFRESCYSKGLVTWYRGGAKHHPYTSY